MTLWRLTLFFLLLTSSVLLAQVELGTLEIHSQLGVEVHWEGVFVGTIDKTGALEVADIPPGSYTIQLTKPGFSPAYAPMEIQPNQRIVLHLLLQPLVAVPVETPTATAVPATGGGATTTPEPPVLTAAEPSRTVPVVSAKTPEPGVGPDSVPGATPKPPVLAAPQPTVIIAPATGGGATKESVVLGPVSGTSTTTDALRPPYPLVATLAAVALIALVLYSRRNRIKPPTPEPLTPPRPTIHRVPRSESSPGFLNDLKTRERDLDRLASERRGKYSEPNEIIDVEVLEVTEAPDTEETS